MGRALRWGADRRRSLATAATISVKETLDLLDGTFVGVSNGVTKGEYALWPAGNGYQDENLVNSPDSLETRRELWSQLHDWMKQAEEPFLDDWFAKAASRSIEAWNKEHGLGGNNDDRQAGKSAVFNMENSTPRGKGKSTPKGAQRKP